MRAKNGDYENIKNMLDGMILIQKSIEHIIDRDINLLTSKKQVNFVKKLTKRSQMSILGLNGKI